MAKNINLIVLGLLLCGCANLQETSGPKKLTNHKKDYRSEDFTKFVALGESTTAGGWSTSRDRCWVPRLGEMINDFQATKMEVLNYGIGANLLSDKAPEYEKSGKPAANIRLKKHVLDEKPDLLIISYGLNDARGATPLKLFRDEMIKIIKRVRAAEGMDPVIVLLGPYYMTDFKSFRGRFYTTWNNADLELFREYNECIRKVAQQQDCLFVDLLDAYKQTDWMIHYDGIHANDLGHRIVANRIFEVLAQNCYCLAKRTKQSEKTSPRWRDESCLKLGFE